MKTIRDSPGGPVIETLHFHCRGSSFDPRLGNYDPACCMVQPKEKRKKKTINLDLHFTVKISVMGIKTLSVKNLNPLEQNRRE